MTITNSTVDETTLNNLFHLPDERFNLKLAGDDELNQVRSDADGTQRHSEAANWSPVRTEVGSRAAELLDVSVTSILTDVWNQIVELRKYTDKNAYPPDYSSFVSLADHSFTFSFSPSIQLLIDGNVLKTFTLDVSADLEVKGLELEIRNGKIMSVTGGSLEGSGNISVGNVLIWSKDFDSVRLPGTVQLNDGLSLPAL